MNRAELCSLLPLKSGDHLATPGQSCSEPGPPMITRLIQFLGMSRHTQTENSLKEWRGRIPCPCKCGAALYVYMSLYDGRYVDVDMFLLLDLDNAEEPPASHNEDVLRTYRAGAELGLDVSRRLRPSSGD